MNARGPTGSGRRPWKAGPSAVMEPPGTPSAPENAFAEAAGGAERNDGASARLLDEAHEQAVRREFRRACVGRLRAWSADSGHGQENRALRPPVSETPGTEPPGSRTTLFQHALRLHEQVPGAPLPRDGEPHPDQEHRCRGPRPDHPRDREQVGAEVTSVLDGHFDDPRSAPCRLVGRFTGGGAGSAAAPYPGRLAGLRELAGLAALAGRPATGAALRFLGAAQAAERDVVVLGA